MLENEIDIFCVISGLCGGVGILQALAHRFKVAVGFGVVSVISGLICLFV